MWVLLLQRQRCLPYFSRHLGLVLAGLTTLGAPAHAQSTVRPADAFVESIGVNTHWSYGNVYTSQYGGLKAKLGSLGIRYVRDGANPTTYARANDLYTAYGIRTNMLTGRRVTGYPSPLDPNQIATELGEIKANALAATASIEGPNEYDLSHDGSETDWVGKIKRYQQDLYTKAKADASLKNLLIIGPSFTSQGAYATVGNLDPYLDHANIHLYQSDRHPGTSGWGDNGYGSISWHFQYLISKQTPSGKPVESTEAGYHNDPGADGLSEEAEGKYLPRTYAEFFRRGVARTYKYELVNQGTSGKESVFGLLRNDLSEKPAFRALKNIIGLLNDPGASFTPTPLTYTLTGASADVRQLLFQKRNGDYLLLLWLEVPSWDPVANVNLYPAAQGVTVNLPAGINSATLYTLNNNGDGNVTTATISNGAVGVSVTDKISIVKLSGSVSPPSAGSPVSGGVYRLSPLSAPTKCLDVAGVSQADGANVHQWEYFGQANQQWKLVSTNDGYYKLVSINSPAGQEQVLDVDRCLASNGTNVQQYHWLDNACQRWKLTLLADGSYKLTPKTAVDQGLNQVLDVTGCSTDNNDKGQANVQLYQWLDSPCQHWRLTLLSSPSSTSSPSLATTASQRTTAGVEVYPNPATDQLTVRITLAQPGNVTLSLVNGLGRVVHQRTHAHSAGTQTLPLEVRGLPAGFYLLRVRQPHLTQTRRVLIQP